ncbi:SAM-dependent methyltransferase [Actinoplanes sp. NPDC051411]|jgi:predicted O-methyltransferase YrrM|uniref:O-methyltransferase n=1 Tax=Actinoplanes sp. NPDC051411 TaxID=3155522 RepID=UPI0034393FFE
MSISGTAQYENRTDLPPLVARAVEAARRAGFETSCVPAQGRLLQVLAGGAMRIGETGTGYAVGLAWMASGAPPGARLFSIDRSTAPELDDPRVEIRRGDWRELKAEAPFDLLVLDGGGQGKGDEPPLDPAEWLRPGGVVVIDDITPMTSWPPRHDGRPDEARLYWLEHPRLRTAEIRITPDAATLVGTYIG